jgi:hypothetical protein
VSHEQPDRCRFLGSSLANPILTEISETLQWWGAEGWARSRTGRALARARAAVDSAQAAEPSVKSRSPTSVGDWIVASVLIVKGEDFKIVNQPIE